MKSNKRRKRQELTNLNCAYIPGTLEEKSNQPTKDKGRLLPEVDTLRMDEDSEHLIAPPDHVEED